MQLKVGLSDGTTLAFELPEELDRWLAREADPAFQASIRSMALVYRGVFHALPAPVAFRRVGYRAEARLNGNGTPTACRIGYVADDVMVYITVYLKGSPPMSRFDVRKVGRLRWPAPGFPVPQDRGGG